nr:MAG TPA: major capsid protein [Caudoviricetes sp.]
MNSLELKDKQSVLIKRCQEIVNSCKKEVREMTEDEQKEFDANKEEIKNLKDELKRLQDKLSAYDEDMPKMDDENETKENNQNKENRSIKMENKKFNLLKELRSAYETGKKINLAEQRAYSVTDEGDKVVATDVYDIWGPLRAKNVLVEAGAKFISGIKNNVQIPLMGAVSVNWANETEAATDGSAAFTKKVLTPKRITAKYPISLELLAQDTLDVESAVREDIIKAVNAKVEETLLGSDLGDTSKPSGLFNGKTPDKIKSFGDLVALEAKVEDANVDGECKYVMSNKAKADFRVMPKSTKSTQLVMEQGEIDGTEVLATSHVKDKNVLYGDFSNLVIATWDNITIDVVRDVASVGNGNVTIVVNAFVDAALIRDNALVYGTTAAE